MATGGPYQDMQATPIAGIAPEAVMPGLPGQPNVFAPDGGNFPTPDDGLPPIMSNDRVPAYPPAQPAAPPAGQVNVAQQDALLNRPQAEDETESARRRSGFRVSPGQFGWAVGAQDFNPNGFKPNESRSTQVGKYGGAPLYATTLAFPDAVIASRLQGIAEQKEALAKQMAKFDPMANMEDVKAPEYRDDFQRGAMADINGYVDKATAMWGEEEGMKRLMNPNSEEGRGLRERNMAWTTIARLTNQGTDTALAITKGMDEGVLERNPYLYKLAQEQLHKTGTQAGSHDPKALARSMTAFQGVASLDDQVHKDGIVQLLKEAGSVEQLAEQVKRGDNPHYRAGFAGILTKKTVNRDDVIDALTDRYFPQYEGYMGRDDMKNYFRSIAGNLSEETLRQTQLHASSSGGGGDAANNAANYRVEQTAMPEGTVNAFGVAAGASKRGGSASGTGFTGSYPTITLFGSSNKQAKLTNPLSFRYGDRDVFMYPERVMQVGGMPMVLGKEVGMPRTRAQKEEAAKGMGWSVEKYEEVMKNPETAEAQDVVEKFGVLRPMAIPLLGNEAQIEGLGYDPDRIKSELSNATGTRLRKEQQPFIDPTKAAATPATKTKATKAPPKPGAKFINGQWWVKINGKVVPAE